MSVEDYLDVSGYSLEDIEALKKENKMTFKYDEILCPKCKGPMISRKGKYGVFWGCKSFPNCDGTRDSEGRSKFEREQEKHKNIYNKEYDGSDIGEMEDEENGKPTFRFNRDR